MAQNFIPIEDVVNDFMLLHTEDSYVNNVTITQARIYAKRGLRELGFDTMKRIKTLKLPVNKNIGVVQLPIDYVNYTKLGFIGQDGLVYIFAENNNIGAPMEIVDEQRVDAKDSPSVQPQWMFEESFFRTAGFQDVYNDGGFYGLGGGHRPAEFRINLEQNRIELSSKYDFDDVVIEYIADEAISDNPSVHVFCVEVLDRYIYNEIIKRSTVVPYNEKIRADEDYKRALKIANSRMRSFTKEQALINIRKNNRLSPRF